ncbi:hypothetical protein Emed_007046 [Eimeria media]
MKPTSKKFVLVLLGDICPAGGYCIAGAEEVAPCPAGYYNPREGATSLSACILCPLGVYCDGQAVTDGGIAGPCRGGYYCLEGSESATSVPAPAGYFAPEGSSSPLACYPGTYQTSDGSASCLPCPRGRYCQALAMTGVTGCPEASYCPEGSVAPQPCPAGTYSTTTLLYDVSQCTSCPAGEYCGGQGLKASSGKCQAGFYCGGGSSTSAPQEESGQNQICPEGHYCPAGSRSPEPCSEGTYSPSRQAISAAACLPCDPGRVCSKQGLAAPDGICPAGSYCEKGKPVQKCPPGNECPAGSAAPTPCKHGTFSAATGAEQCQECPEGHYCEDATIQPGEPQKCPKGYFCPAGTAFLGSATWMKFHASAISFTLCCSGSPILLPKTGTLRREVGATSLDECEPCPAGKYCKEPGAEVETGSVDEGYYSSIGATSAKPLAGCMLLASVAGGQTTPCEGFDQSFTSFTEAESSCLSLDKCKGIVETPAGEFYLSGSHAPTLCTAGKYCSAYGLAATSGDCSAGYACPEGSTSPHPDSALCPAGHYCQGGVNPPQKCPPGKVLSGRGASKEDDCLPCPPGFYCQGSGLSAPTGPCPEGYYCEKETTDPNNAIPCKAGHMCPEGSPAPVPCPPGTKQPNERQTSCEPCSAGEACSGGATDGKPCPQGFLCPHAVAVETSFPCAPGTYAPTSDSGGSTCTPCPAGHYCESAGSTKPTAPCTGYYCLDGTEWREPTTFCKHGEYCPPGSKAPLACPPNHFCNTVKLMEPSGPCSAGFICNSRSTTPRPTGNETGAVCEENMDGRPCKKGHYCPAPASPLIAGTGFGGTGGEGLPAPQSYLMLPSNAVMDPETRDIYIADFKNFAIKRVSGTTGRNAVVEYDVVSSSFSVVSQISSIASKPLGLALDSECSHLYVADSANHRVLKYTLESKQVETIVGPDAPQQVPSIELNFPSGVAIGDDVLYVADTGNRRTSRIVAGEGAVAAAVVNQLPDDEQKASKIKLEMPVSVALADDQDGVVLVISDAKARA